MDSHGLVEMKQTEPYWTGAMSTSIGLAIEAIREKDPQRAHHNLKVTLAEFIASPVPSEELRGMLRPYLK